MNEWIGSMELRTAVTGGVKSVLGLSSKGISLTLGRVHLPCNWRKVGAGEVGSRLDW